MYKTLNIFFMSVSIFALLPFGITLADDRIVNPTGEISGVTIEDQSVLTTNGAGVYTDGSQSSELIIKNSIIQNNDTNRNGGGVGVNAAANDISNVIISNTQIIGNFVPSSGYPYSGGGLWLQHADDGDPNWNLYKIHNINIVDSQINSNSASRGGGISLQSRTETNSMKGGIITIDHSEINNNVSTATGTNENYDKGGAGIGLYSDDAVLNVLNDSHINNNTGAASHFGGGINQNGKNTVVTIQDSEIAGNSIGNGGGIFVYNAGSRLNLINARITDNVAVEKGGGILSNGILTTSFGTKFENNSVSSSTLTDGGGALFLGEASTSYIQDAFFINNHANNANGGAIRTRDGSVGSNSDAKFDIVNTKFAGNSALNGGAIYNNFYNSSANAGYVTISNSLFDGNLASDIGGAIYNSGQDTEDGTSSIKIVDSTFSNNVATSSGGAIYNVGRMALEGTNVFTNNTANSVANDFHNVGTIGIVSGITTIDGGITGTTGTLNITETGSLNIGTSTIVQKTINLNGTLVANLRSSEVYQITADDLNGTGFVFVTAADSGTYKLFGEDTFDNVQSTLYDFEFVDGGKSLTLSRKSVTDIAKDSGISNQTAAVISGLMDSSATDLNDLSVKMQEQLALGNKRAVRKIADGISAEKERGPIIQSLSYAVNNMIAGIIDNRINVPSPKRGRNGGESASLQRGLWGQLLYNRSELNGDFTSNSYGWAFGSDILLSKKWTFGGGYSFINSDVSATVRDIDINTSTFFVYGQYRPSKWYVTAMADYSLSEYNEHGDVLGIKVKSDYNAHTFGANVMAGYELQNGITPEFGLRYLQIMTENYTNSLGIKNDGDKTNYLTGVLGAKYAKDTRFAKRSAYHYDLRGSLQYDVISDAEHVSVTIPGVDAYTVTGDRLSRIGVNLGGGFGVKYENVEISLNYDLGVREDYTSHTGLINFRYNF